MEIILNDSQKEAVSFLQYWWTSRKFIAILEGEAGTGKTTILKGITKYLFRSVPLFTAPTNEACRQLELVLPEGSKILTTYAALGYSMDTGTADKKFIKRKNSAEIESSNLVIVDEASMVPKKLLEELIGLANQGKKILFLGDRYQLPPVVLNLKIAVEAESPVFEEDFPTFRLTKVERSSGKLLDYQQHLRNLVYAKHKIYKKSEWVTSKDNLYEYILSKEGRLAFKDDIAKVIGFTNDEVDGWNHQIRGSLHRRERNNLPRFLFKDRLLAVEPITHLPGIENVEYKKAKNILQNFKDPIIANCRMQIKKIEENQKLFGVPVWKLTMFEGQTIYVCQDDEKLEVLRQELLNEALTYKSDEAIRKAYRRLHSAMSLFANVKYSYSFTAHRSQGMSIPEVWVNLNDINKCQNVMLRHKLLYVAASRAKQTMFLVE